MHDFSVLKAPDYDKHPGMAGHKPATDEERKQGFVIRKWAGIRDRMRCCFCPYDQDVDYADMAVHLMRHWLQQNPHDIQVPVVATESKPDAAQYEALLQAAVGVVSKELADRKNG